MISGYLLRHDLDTGLSTVLLSYYSPRTRKLERIEDDVGVAYDESEFPLYNLWLKLPNPPTREIHRDELRLNAPEIDELVRYEIQSVLNVPLMQDGVLWGYAELRETRYRRYFAIKALDTVARIFGHMPTRVP